MRVRFSYKEAFMREWAEYVQAQVRRRRSIFKGRDGWQRTLAELRALKRARLLP